MHAQDKNIFYMVGMLLLCDGATKFRVCCQVRTAAISLFEYLSAYCNTPVIQSSYEFVLGFMSHPAADDKTSGHLLVLYRRPERSLALH